MNLQSKKVLVTGADGFIGSHLVETLLSRCASVKAFVYYNSFGSHGWIDSLSQEIQSSIEIYTGDIRDYHCVLESMRDIDVVFHLAALIGIPFSYQSPDLYVDTNIKGTLNVIQAARSLNLERVVHTSTSEVYGTAQYVPINEEHPLNAQSPYAATKTAADQLALSFYRSFGTPVTIVRPFNTYGPRQSARAVIPTVITQIANNKSTLKIGAVTPTRDFTFVKDTAEGFIAASQSERALGEVINLGSNFEISISDTISLIAKLMGQNINIDCDEVRIRPEKSEVQRLWADTSKAKRTADWEAKYSGIKGFEEGLKETITWFTDPSNLKNYRANIYNF